MPLNQMNEDFNDAFETYFPKSSFVSRCTNRALGIAAVASLRLRKRVFGGRVLVNERIVEYPQALRWIDPEGVVLDIGCVSSRLPIQLASLGYQVYGIDGREYVYQHPNVSFCKTDIFEWTPPCAFDIALLISTIEHFGLGVYGDIVAEDADCKAIMKIHEWLKPDGQLIVSVPFGQADVTSKHRIYDSDRLKRVFANFRWQDSKYYQRVDEHWVPSSAEQLSQVSSPTLPPNGVAILNLRKS